MTIFSEVLIFAAFWLFAVLSTLFYMHMFQLNSYRADDQWHWMLKNRGKVVPRSGYRRYLREECRHDSLRRVHFARVPVL